MKALYARAGRALHESGGRLLLIEALLLTLLLVPAYTLPIGTASLLWSSFGASEALGIWIFAGTVLLLLLITLFLATPLIMGLFLIAGRLVAGEDTALADLFEAFSSWKHYGNALRVGKQFFFSVSLLFLLLFGAFFALEFVVADSDVLASLVAASLPPLSVAWYFFVPHFGNAAAQLVGGNWRRHSYREGLLFRARFFLWILLGALTLGLLLLADVLPRMLVAYFEDRTTDLTEDGSLPSFSDK